MHVVIEMSSSGGVEIGISPNPLACPLKGSWSHCLHSILCTGSAQKTSAKLSDELKIYQLITAYGHPAISMSGDGVDMEHSTASNSLTDFVPLPGHRLEGVHPIRPCTTAPPRPMSGTAVSRIF